MWWWTAVKCTRSRTLSLGEIDCLRWEQDYSLVFSRPFHRSFCNNFGRREVLQPINTWSSLGIIASALAIALSIDIQQAFNGEAAGHPANPMTCTFLNLTMSAVLVTLLCPRSMALHASVLELIGISTSCQCIFFWPSSRVTSCREHLSLGCAASCLWTRWW